MSDVLLERIAVALEKIATATQTVVVAERIDRATDSVVEEIAAAMAGLTKPRKTKSEPAKEPEPVQAEPEKAAAPLVQPIKLAPAQKAGGFLDEDEEPVKTAGEIQAEAVRGSGSAALLEGKTEKEQRDVVRKHMINLQKALDPERALKVMKAASGGAETLISVKVDKYVDVLDAIAAAMPK